MEDQRLIVGTVRSQKGAVSLAFVWGFDVAMLVEAVSPFQAYSSGGTVVRACPMSRSRSRRANISRFAAARVQASRP